MSNSRVPQTVTEFNVYVNNALDYLNSGEPKNSVRLTITDAEVVLLTGIVDRWKPLYVLYTDKKKHEPHL